MAFAKASNNALTQKVGALLLSIHRFKRKIKDVKSEKNDRGKDIKGKTRKDKIMKIINEMNLTNDQKDALYLLAGYAESTIRKAPWR